VPNVKWVHSRLRPGWTVYSFPELVKSPGAAHQRERRLQRVAGRIRGGRRPLFREGFPPHDPQPGGRCVEPFDIVEASGQTVGIVGFGDIGRAVATRVHALECGYWGSNAHGPPAHEAGPAGRADLWAGGAHRNDFALDYVVAAAPLTPETLGMIGEPELAAMKPARC